MKRLIATSSQDSPIGNPRSKDCPWSRWRAATALIITVAVVGFWFLPFTTPATPIVAAEGPPAPLAQLSEGQKIYEERCAACHGISGDGAGPGAERLFTKPRDFTRDEYKIKSTVGDEFPTREDIVGVIAKGMPGSSMPAWEGILTRSEMEAVSDYIQTFGRFFTQEGYGTTVIDIPDRVDPTAESIARGAELYAGDIECVKCHGPAGRGDGSSALELVDNVGNVIYPADLTQPQTFRGGADPEDIYLRLRTGLTGSPMPAFADAISETETWDLVNFILSLSPEDPEEPAVLLVSQFVNGPLPDDPDDPIWADVEAGYFPLIAQIVRNPRYFQSAINAVRVKSLYNNSEIAFHVAWNDRTETTGGDAVDAMAIQFPQELSDGAERPYFVFGDSNRAVYQMYWTADQNVAIERNASGLNQIEDQLEDQWQTMSTARYEDGRWQLVFRRPLHTSDSTDLIFETDRFIPISFATWDGYAEETGNQFGLTTWSVVFLQSPTPVIQYARIPGVMLGVVVVELLVVWLVRRANR